MHLPHLSLLSLLRLLPLWTSSSTSNNQQNILSAHTSPQFQSPLVVRNATKQDFDAIASVITTAFAPLPYWKYVYQFREEYPEDHHVCMQKWVGLIMELEPVRIEVVVLGGDGGEDDGKGDSGGEGEGVGVDIRNEGKVVAVAIWRWYRGVDDEDELGWTDFALRHGWTRAGCAHRDLNVTRALAMAAKFSTKKEKYVDAVFGRDQLYLELLGTHPDYQGKGAGSQLVKAGLERGTEAGENITLIAHPTAETFYLGLGFREHRNFSVGALEGSERFGYNVLVYEGGVGNASVAA